MSSEIKARQFCEQLRDELVTTNSLADVLGVVLRSYSTTFQEVCDYDCVAVLALGGAVSVSREFEFSIVRQLGSVAQIVVRMRYSPNVVDNQSIQLRENLESPDELRKFFDDIQDSVWFPAVNDAIPTRCSLAFPVRDNEISIEELRETMSEDEAQEFKKMYYSNDQDIE